MRYLRAALAVAGLTLALIVPGGAAAEIDRLRIAPAAELGLDGASVGVPVTVDCDRGQAGFLLVGVSQPSLARPFRQFGDARVRCSGFEVTSVVVVESYGAAPFELGSAFASAALYVRDRATGEFFEASAGRMIQLE